MSGDLGLEAAEAVARALEIALRWGGIDGGHHKAWVIDQMVQALTGDDYWDWVRAACEGGDEWDQGIAP